MANTQAALVTVTTAEAAFVAGLSPRQVQKAIDSGPVRPALAHGRRVLDEADLVYLTAMKTLAAKLKPVARGSFYEALKKSGLETGAVPLAATFGHDIKADFAAVSERLERLRQLHELVERRKGTAVIKGTTIEAHRIAALLAAGVTAERVLADHPSLDRAQVTAAADYAAAHPKAGRPFPARSVKQAFDDAGLDSLADILDARRR
jgi:uncharacterized protein (DUF433 family)